MYHLYNSYAKKKKIKDLISILTQAFTRSNERMNTHQLIMLISFND